MCKPKLHLKLEKIKEGIRTLVNNYFIFIISFAVCFIISRIDVLNMYITDIFNSINIDKLFESTITFTSIILGFSGTLISHILNMKFETEKKENQNINMTKISWYFKNVNFKQFSNTILTSIISSIALIILSLIMLTNDIMDQVVKFYFFYLWLFIFLIFVLYEVSLYKLFISLLFNNEVQKSPMIDSESQENIEKCMNSIEENTQNRS